MPFWGIPIRKNLFIAVVSGSHFLLSFLIYAFLLREIPPGHQTDAFFGAMVVPRFLLAVIGNSILHAAIPHLSRNKAAFQKSSIFSFAAIQTVIFIIVAFVWGLLAPYVLPWLLKGFSEKTLDLAIRLSWIHSVGIIFGGVACFFSAVRQARGEILRSETAVLCESVLSFILLFCLLSTVGIFGAAVIIALRPAIQLLLLVPYKMDKQVLGKPSSITKAVLQDGLPLMASGAYSRIHFFVDRFLSSLAPSGGFTLYYLSQQIWGVAAEVVHRSMVSPIVPALAVAAKEDENEFHHLLREKIRRLLIMVGLGISLFLLLSLLAFAFWSIGGIRVSREVRLFGMLMTATSGVFIGTVFEQIMARAYYVLGRIGQIAIIRAVLLTVGIGLKIAGYFWFGLIGLGVSTSIFNLLSAGVLFLAFQNITRQSPKEARGHT